MHPDPIPFYYRMTSGIRITVRPSYLGDRSNQLRTRRWLSHDESVGDTVVEGEGVVGEQPHLLPGQVHEYRSFCVLKAPLGWMEGAYRFVRDDGSSFEAIIPRFTLAAEPRADTVS